MNFETIVWQDNTVIILDQRLLPHQEKYLRLIDHRDIAQAIRTLAVRGAPAIGVAGAMGVALGALSVVTDDAGEFAARVREIALELIATRPTAVNLSWAILRMLNILKRLEDRPIAEIKTALIAEAQKVREEDIVNNHALGEHGHKLIANGDTILTHCNAGALATAGFGTALGVLYAAVQAGKKLQVYADETRPLLQGARLTAWELAKNDVPVTLITDSMAAVMMKAGLIDKVIVGADRIATNGDVANKIGTYSVAICARHHQIPFYVAAPLSTIDLQTSSGDEIPIEEREITEITQMGQTCVAPLGITVRNPAFDVTPVELVTGLITEKGVIERPNRQKILALFA